MGGRGGRQKWEAEVGGLKSEAPHWLRYICQRVPANEGPATFGLPPQPHTFMSCYLSERIRCAINPSFIVTTKINFKYVASRLEKNNA